MPPWKRICRAADFSEPSRAGRRDEPAVRAAHDERRPPGGPLARSAAEAGRDLVVLGTRRRRGVRRLPGGRVAEKVMRASERPVLVVRDHGEIATWSGRAGAGRARPLGHEPGLP